MTAVECPECGRMYGNIGNHWAANESHRPQFTKNQLDIITGVLMGDGYISTNNRNPSLEVDMTTPQYLEYLDNKFGILGTGVSLHKTAEECAERDRKSGFNKNARSENYSDKYRWTTRTHPDLNEFSDWYKGGRKTFPKDICITPTVLKHWYCCDGSLVQGTFIKISMSNERNEKGKIESMFRNESLPLPYTWNECDRGDGTYTCDAIWNKDNSKDLFSFMGNALPEFEYKWI